MILPYPAARCLKILERAGYESYVVGGCVRDLLLEQLPNDFDICTSATPEEIQQLFRTKRLILSGLKHGTVGVVIAGEIVEITTFRAEGDYQDNRHPGWVKFVRDIKEDLARRDFTVNAMAYSPSKGLCDPFGGQEDLQNKILRTVGDPIARFREDSLRILRGVRFAVCYGLTPDEKTLEAMFELAPLMDNLARERVFTELCKLLPCITAKDLLRYQKILTQVIPELAPCVGFDQHSPYHAYDVYTHTAQVVERVPEPLSIRLAALLHDIGKVPTFSLDEQGRGHFYGHAQKSAEMADALLRRLKAPTQLREQVVQLIDLHMTPIPTEKKALRRWRCRLGDDPLCAVILLQEADTLGKGIDQPEALQHFQDLIGMMSALIDEEKCLKVKDLAIDGYDLMAFGRSGPEIGRILNALLEKVMDEELPNEANALLAAAVKM